MGKKNARPRSHVIAEVAQKHLELMAAQAGFTALAVPQGSDYGIDMPVITFDKNGNQESGYLLIQIKASDDMKISSSGEVIIVVKKKHILQWSKEAWPVILVQYDAKNVVGYWVYIQRYLQQNAINPGKIGGSITLRIPVGQKISSAAFLSFAEFKRRVIIQLTGMIDHG